MIRIKYEALETIRKLILSDFEYDFYSEKQM